MNDSHSQHPDVEPDPDGEPAGPFAEPLVAVGDVLVRREAGGGYGLFNYRGERVLDLPVRSSGEATRLAAEIVSPWHGRVSIDEAAELLWRPR